MPVLQTLDPVTGTPQSVARRRQIAEAMLANGMDTSGISTIPQGLADLANAFVGARQMRRADRQEEAGTASASTQRQALMDAMLNGGVPGNDAISGLANNPWATSGDQGMVGALLQQRMTPPTPPTPQMIDETLNGVYGQRDPSNNTFNPFPEYMQPGAGGGATEPPNTVADGQIYDWSTRTWITPPAGAGNEPPDVISGIGPNGEQVQLVFAPEHENANEFGFVQMGGAKIPDGLSVTLPDGTVIRQGGGGRATEGEANANTFATRMERADPMLNAFAAAGMNFWEHIASGAGIIGNFLISPERQQFDQAARDFINANLRRESGATITPPEFDNARRQYLPMPGDGPEVLAQKAANRRTAMETIRQAAGPFANTGGGAPSPAAGVESVVRRPGVQPNTPANFDQRFAPGGWMDIGDGIRIRELP